MFIFSFQIVEDFKWLLSILSSQGISIFVREARSCCDINLDANAKEDGLSGVDLIHSGINHTLNREREREREEKMGREGWCDLGNEREMMADIMN